jgi:hypothetical protein
MIFNSTWRKAAREESCHMDERLIALGDILGFKDTLRTTPLATVVNEYLGYFRKALQHTLQLDGWPTAPLEFPDLQSKAKIGLEWFSDTIILYTTDESNAAALNLISTVTWLLFETMYHPSVRLRFGIDYGELFVSPNAGQHVGNGLVGAHELERTQEWAGGAITRRAFDRLDQDARHYLVDYPVPVKDDEHATMHAINWTLGVHAGFASPYSGTRREPDENDPQDVVRKWRNTKQFHDTICTGCTTRHKRK